MKNILSSFVKEFIKIVIIVAIAVPTIALFAAWTGPTGAPPTNNADAPVNVGAIDQIKTYETDGLGNLISGKSGGLGVGTFFSRFGTLLATDGGNVGIGMGEDGEIPQAKLHVDGGDAIFEGQIQIKGGLPEKDKVLVSSDNTGAATWETITADMLIPQGYEEVFDNGSEDIYSGWNDLQSSDMLLPACDSNVGISGPFGSSDAAGVYTCSPMENRVCLDSVALTCTDKFMCDRMFGPDGPLMYRKVECFAAKTLRKNAWKYVDHNYTGKALIVSIDRRGSSENCYVNVDFSNADGTYSCSRRNFEVDLAGSYNLSRCKDQLLRHIQTGNVCRLPFQDRIRSFNGTWDIGGLEGGGTGALELNFIEIK